MEIVRRKTTMPEPLLTASEVAALLKLNVETVYTLITTRGLPAAKIGGRWRFEEARVRAWVETCYDGAARRIDPATHAVAEGHRCAFPSGS